MSRRTAHPAAIALASDGSVLINLADFLPSALSGRLSRVLGARPVFVGVVLSRAQALKVVARLDGAAAEAGARLLAGSKKGLKLTLKASAKRR